jgi:hypothetical protein
MHFVHSRGTLHRALLDALPLSRPDASGHWPSINSRYLALEFSDGPFRKRCFLFKVVDPRVDIQFGVKADVNSAKVAEFVERIEDWEKQNGR